MQFNGGGRLQNGRQGSALLAVFWALTVLGMVVFSWLNWLQQRVQQHGEDNRAAEALAMAHSGIALALHPDVNRYTSASLLEREVAPGMGYRVTIEGEGGRLNLKFLLDANGTDKFGILNQWLELVVGVEFQDRQRLLDCLADYVDADNIARLHGQEDSMDYHPANRKIESLEELKRIHGMEPLLSYPGWQDWFTLETWGQLDLMEVPEDLLRLLPVFKGNENRVQQWLKIRSGPDGILHTEDDPTNFKAMPQVASTLVINPKNDSWVKLDAMAIVGEQTIRIRSEGYSGEGEKKVSRQVQVVVRKTNGAPQIRSWIE